MENNIKLAKLTQYTPMICSLLGIIAHLGMTSEHVECPEFFAAMKFEIASHHMGFNIIRLSSNDTLRTSLTCNLPGGSSLKLNLESFVPIQQILLQKKTFRKFITVSVRSGRVSHECKRSGTWASFSNSMFFNYTCYNDDPSVFHTNAIEIKTLVPQNLTLTPMRTSASLDGIIVLEHETNDEHRAVTVETNPTQEFFADGLLFVETHTLPDETNRTQESIDESLNVLLQNESSEGSPLVPTDSQPGMTVPYIIIGIAISVAVVFALVGIVSRNFPQIFLKCMKNPRAASNLGNESTDDEKD